MSIAALYDAAEEAGKGPVQPGLALRAVLALLFEASHQSKRRDRRPFDAFWKAVADPGREDLHELDRNCARQHAAKVQIAAIARTFGMMPETEEYQQTIEALRQSHRMATDPEYRCRMQAAADLRETKYVPRGMTREEWKYHKSQGWHERPR